MSVLVTVFIAIAVAVIAFIIGICVGGSIKEPNAESKPIDYVHEGVVLSKVVIPKRITKLEYNKKVNALLKEVVDKAVDVWVVEDSKPYKRKLANQLYHEWHSKIENADYRNYNPDFQCLVIVGRRFGGGFKFDAFWDEKLPKKKD